MVSVFLLSTPRRKNISIFKEKLWGFEEKYEETWKKFPNSYALFLERGREGYWIIGGGIVSSIKKNYKPNPDWSEGGTERSKYPLRILFGRVFRIEGIPAENYFKDLPESFTVIERELPLELQKYFAEVEYPKTIKTILKLLESIIDRKINEDIVSFIPPIFFKPLVQEVTSEEFEDINAMLFRLLGFNVKQYGYKYQGEEVWDLELEKLDKPVIIDVKNSDNYFLSADERRKLLDYAKRKFEMEKRPVDLMVVAKGFNKLKIDKLLKLKGEMESRGYGWLYVIKYADILSLIPEKCNKMLINLLEKLKDLSLV